MEAEEIFKNSNDGHGKRKHLVAAELPNSPFNCHCNAAARGSSSPSWPVTTMLMISSALVVALSMWMYHNGGGGGSSMIKWRTGYTVAALPCSGLGFRETNEEACKCYACFGGRDCSQVVPNCVIDVDHGDPTMYEEFWFRSGADTVTLILGYQRMSYFARSAGRGVWFMEKELEDQIRKLHGVVGNAVVTPDTHIVVGTGSTQLFQAALFALTDPDQPAPTHVVSAAPFYSSFPAVTDYLRSALFVWAGDAASFDPRGEPYIELVTSPNNPDGKIQHAVVESPPGMGHVVHDLAYYWPHYTPITAPANHDIMLFTLSKSTGHAGTRIGWAILKDKNVAKRMTKFMELNTIGVSQDSQVRATQIIKAVVQGYEGKGESKVVVQGHGSKLFHFGADVMEYRWRRLREALNGSEELIVPEFEPGYCKFFQSESYPTPAFAWLQCLKAIDCELALKVRGIVARSGRHFGVGAEFVRVSMLDRNRKFEMLVDRLAHIDFSRTPG